MTNTLAVKRGDKVLEIGTGSGYQSAYLANLTPNVWSIEIIPALAKRTRALYDRLIARGYSEYRAIRTRNADGYYGWQESAPFDKIIVTCGIDHIPPPLLQQLTPDGIMVIPVGPPGAQHVIKATKTPVAGRQRRRRPLRHLRRRDHPLRALHRLAFLVKGSSQLRPLRELPAERRELRPGERRRGPGDDERLPAG